MSRADVFVSVVAVLRDHARLLAAFLAELTPILEQNYSNYEIVFIDNASTDDTEATIKGLLTEHKCVRYLRLTGGTDDETAVMVGLDAAIGDFVVVMHPDFDPPGVLPAMVDMCRGGTDAVLGVDAAPVQPGPVYRGLRGLFLSAARRIVGIDLPTGTTGYRVLSRHAVNAIVRVRKRKRYFALILRDVGLTPAHYAYQRISRSGERPIRSLPRALRLGMSVLVHNSIVPLRLISVLGLLGSGLSFLYSFYVIAIYLFKSDVLPGWTTLSLQVSGLFALAFLMLALMGEYLGRLLEETSDRPLYHTRPELSSAVMLADRQRRNVLDRSDQPP